MPATFSTRVIVTDPSAAGSPRLSRSQRLLLAGAAVTGLWLLGSLGHPAAAHAEAAVRPAAPPVSTVSNPLTRLPAGPPLALSRPAIRDAVGRLAGSSSTPRRIVAPIAIRARVLPTLPAASLPAPNGLPGLPAVSQLPMPGSLPVPPVGSLPLPPLPGGPLAGLPGPTVAAVSNQTESAMPAAGIGGRFGPALLTAAFAGTPAGIARRTMPAPIPQPLPGRPDAPPALLGAGSAAWTGFERSLPLAVLPTAATPGSAGLIERPAAGSAAPRRRSCAPDVSPD
jgi:hypothetical protein